MKGRKRQPSMLIALHGKPGGRTPPKGEPKPVGDLKDAPAWMSEAQKLNWDYAIEHSPPGMLKKIDRGALAVWVVAESLHRAACEQQATVGLIVKAPVTGAPIQSPYLPIINRQGLIMLKAASELGFSPVSRPRIGLVTPFGDAAETKHGKNGPKRSLDSFLDDAPSLGALN